MHNLRLFPKGEGVDAYQLSGIAARCDWAIITDDKTRAVSIHGDLSRQPRTVFLSMRSLFLAIPYFYAEILPKIENRFILISGSEDFTIPNQVDARWRSLNSVEKDQIDKIINDERVIHWFAENRDEDRPKMSSLPTGYVFIEEPTNNVQLAVTNLPVSNRPLKAFCAHRTRGGKQWEGRRRLTNLCKQHFSEFVTVLEEEVSLASFQHQVRKHPFVLCARGGGLDPSPKAWFCIANGSIPIIKSSVLDDAYSQLPVAFIEEWDEDCLSLGKLQAWLGELAPYYENQQLRKDTLQKLSLDYWWNKVLEGKKY